MGTAARVGLGLPVRHSEVLAPLFRPCPDRPGWAAAPPGVPGCCRRHVGGGSISVCRDGRSPWSRRHHGRLEPVRGPQGRPEVHPHGHHPGHRDHVFHLYPWGSRGLQGWVGGRPWLGPAGGTVAGLVPSQRVRCLPGPRAGHAAGQARPHRVEVPVEPGAGGVGGGLVPAACSPCVWPAPSLTRPQTSPASCFSGPASRVWSYEISMLVSLTASGSLWGSPRWSSKTLAFRLRCLRISSFACGRPPCGPCEGSDLPSVSCSSLEGGPHVTSDPGAGWGASGRGHCGHSGGSTVSSPRLKAPPPPPQVWGGPAGEPCHRHAGLAVPLGHCHRLLLLHLRGRPAEPDGGPAPAAGHRAGRHHSLPPGEPPAPPARAGPREGRRLEEPGPLPGCHPYS